MYPTVCLYLFLRPRHYCNQLSIRNSLINFRLILHYCRLVHISVRVEQTRLSEF